MIKKIPNYNGLNEKDFIEIQNSFIPKIDLNNKIDISNIKTIAGTDIACWEKNGILYGGCSVVVIDFVTHEVIEKVSLIDTLDVEYIPGYLAFKELPLILKTIAKLSIEPDVYMFDGNGYLHEKHMGVATQASFYLNKPCIGVAKSYYNFSHIEYTMPDILFGSYTDIVINNEVYGRAIRTMVKAGPIFISCGNYIDIETSSKIVVSLIEKKTRVPIPTRLADIETHIIRKENS